MVLRRVSTWSPMRVSGPSARSHRLAALIAWAIVAAALAIRLFRADAQSLWYDEGTSAQLATRSARAIVAAAAGDIHPPLYYLLLAAWTRVFGHGVPALRALSAVLGAATVAAVIAIGRRLGGRRLALAAGALAATSPYLIWYGQEARMYVLAGALGAALTALALAEADALAEAGASAEGNAQAEADAHGDPDALVDARPPGTAELQLRPDSPPVPPRPMRRPLPTRILTPAALPIAALVAAALYTQYLAGAAAVAVGGGTMALAWARLRRRGGRWPWPSVLRWLAAFALAAVLFVPWLARAWPALRDWPALGAPVTLGFVAREAVATYAFGIKAPPAIRAWWPVLAVVALAGAVLAWRPRRLGGRRGQRWAASVALWVAAAPPLLVWAASLRRPAWNPKFIIAGAPGFELLLALSVVGLAEAAGLTAGHHCPVGKRRTWTRRNVTALTAAVALIALSLPRLAVWRANAYDAAYQRDDYRGIAAEIAARAGPEDAVVLNAPTQVEVFDIYDRGAHTTYALPRTRPPDPTATRVDVLDLDHKHRDIYGVLWATNESDPDGIVEDALNTIRYKLDDRWFGNVRLATWVKGSERYGRPLIERPVIFGDTIALDRIDAAPALAGTGLYRTDVDAPKRPLVVAAAPDDVVTLYAAWSASAPTSVDYTVFTQLLDAEGHLVATRDMRPHGGMSATSTWRVVKPEWVGLYDDKLPEGAVVDLIALRIPSDTPPGDRYRLVIGLYDPATGQRLAPDTGGDAFEVAKVTVTGRTSNSP